MGLLWFALIIPSLLCVFLLMFYRKATVWWELLIPFGVAALTIAICQFISIKSATNDIEYWGHMAVRAVHEEPFKYDDTCTETYPCGTDKDGNTTYCTRSYHCVESKSRHCYLVNDKGGTYSISYGEYQRLEQAWQMNKYGKEKIITRAGGYTTIGDKYNRPGHGNRHWLYWNEDWRVGVPISEIYTYENRLQAATSTFHWKNISEAEKMRYKLFEYPQTANRTVATILTQGPNFIPADQYLRYMNGWLNTTQAGYKKVRIWVLVFVDQPEKAGEMQEMYWKGGNKNEFIVMLGISKEGDILWHRITSWTKKETIKIEVRDEIVMNMMNAKEGYSDKLDQPSMIQFAKFLGDKVRHGYVKPDFREYNYLSIPPSPIALIVSYLIVLLVSVGVGIFVVKNEWRTGCKDFNVMYDSRQYTPRNDRSSSHYVRPKPTPRPRRRY